MTIKHEFVMAMPQLDNTVIRPLSQLFVSLSQTLKPQSLNQEIESSSIAKSLCHQELVVLPSCTRLLETSKLMANLGKS